MVTMVPLKIHGVPLSQPFRAVVWACLQKRVPFDVHVAVPGSPMKGGTRSDKFLALNPLGTVPVLEDSDVVVVETPAILSYLSDKLGWYDIYPYNHAQRAAVNAYTHWHHSNTRSLAGLFGPKVRPEAYSSSGEASAKAASALQVIEDYWLGGGAPFLCKRPVPSMADLIAYEEVLTVSPGKESIAHPFSPTCHAHTHILRIWHTPSLPIWRNAMRMIPIPHRVTPP